MTAPAKITQADMERATKAVRAAGYKRARFVMDFAQQKIEIFVNEDEESPQKENPWDEE